ncbi:MAG: hypothetical protein HKO67_01245 [Flavobacteriaceae bacterium]|nr:hypothetical protein [Flavobacteriaceae bacterium]
MNILNILKGLENLAVELLLWIVYIPKTLYRIVKDPFWVRTYVNDELDKDEKFTEYMSPVLLYLGTSVILYIVFASLKSGKDINLLEKAQDLETLAFLSLPLFVAIFIEWFRKAPFTRSLILRGLYIQCYFFSPLMLSLFAFLLSLELRFADGKPIFEAIDLSLFPNILFLLTLIWFLGVQIIFISNDLKINRLKSFGMVLFTFFVLYGVFATFSEISETWRDQGAQGEWEYSEFIIPTDSKYYIQVSNKNYADTLNFIIVLNKFDNVEWGVEYDERIFRSQNSDGSVEFSESGGMIIQSIRDSFSIEKPIEYFGESSEIEVGQQMYIKTTLYHNFWIESQKGKRLFLMIYPWKTDLDLAFDVLDADGNSILPWRNEWTRWVRLIYIIVFGYAVFIAFRAFFVYRKRLKLERKNQEAIDQNAIEK